MLERWPSESRKNKQSMCVSFVFELDKIRKKSAECFVLTHEGVFWLDQQNFQTRKMVVQKQKTTPEGVVFELL